MAILGASDSLKCKLMDGTFKEGALWWYMSLPRFSIISYQDLTKKTVQHFSESEHRKMSTKVYLTSARALRNSQGIYGKIQ